MFVPVVTVTTHNTTLLPTEATQYTQKLRNTHRSYAIRTEAVVTPEQFVWTLKLITLSVNLTIKYPPIHSSGHSSQGTTLLLGNHLVVGCGITSGHLPVCVVCSMHLDKHACHSCVIVTGWDVNTIKGCIGTMISAVRSNKTLLNLYPILYPLSEPLGPQAPPSFHQKTGRFWYITLREQDVQKVMF